MPITIQNSAGGGVTLDSTTSSNETLQLPSGGGTLTNTTDLALKAPIASPVFTGSAHVTSGVNTSTRTFLVDNAHSGGSMYNALGVYVGATDRMVTLSAEYNDSIMAFKTAGTERMRIHSAGDVSFGDPLTVAQLIADGEQGVAINGYGGVLAASRFNDLCAIFKRENSDGAAVNFMRDASIVGHIDVGTSSTSYNTSSDYRLKTNVTPMTGATAAVKLLKPCNFDWIAGGNVNGFLAHELAEVVPEAATGTKDAMRDEEYEVTPAVLDDEGNETTAQVMGTRSVPDLQGIDQSKLVPLLTATIQELIARIEALEGE